jgi:hypothetical protein
MLAGVYLDGGIWRRAESDPESLTPNLEAIDEQDPLFQDYKTALQELAQAVDCHCRNTASWTRSVLTTIKRFIVESECRKWRRVARARRKKRRSNRRQACIARVRSGCIERWALLIVAISERGCSHRRTDATPISSRTAGRSQDCGNGSTTFALTRSAEHDLEAADLELGIRTNECSLPSTCNRSSSRSSADRV